MFAASAEELDIPPGEVPKPYTVPPGYKAPTMGEQFRYVRRVGWSCRVVLCVGRSGSTSTAAGLAAVCAPPLPLVCLPFAFSSTSLHAPLLNPGCYKAPIRAVWICGSPAAGPAGLGDCNRGEEAPARAAGRTQEAAAAGERRRWQVGAAAASRISGLISWTNA